MTKHPKIWPPKPYRLTISDPYARYYGGDTKPTRSVGTARLDRMIAVYRKYFKIGQKLRIKLKGGKR